MCGRYVVKHSTKELQEAFAFAEFSEIRLAPRFNVAPTTRVPIVRLAEAGGRELVMARWGLIPGWAKPDAKLPPMINARAESVATKPAFRSAFKSRRCIFPASGYYEWRTSPQGGKLPFFISRADGAPIAFAGLWEVGKAKDGTETLSGAIVTTAAAGGLEAIHDRMPVFLPEESWARWLERDPLPAELAATIFGGAMPHPMTTLAVRPLVNSIRNEGEELLRPAEPEVPRPPEPDLFG
jgi:putative SOS response-associated peptidase YedK